PLDVPNRLLETPDARQRHPERVVGMSRHLRRRAVALRNARKFRAGEGGGLPERALSPLDRTRVVAAPEGQPAHLLVQVRELDVAAPALELSQTRLEAGQSPLVVPRVPVESVVLEVQAHLGFRIRQLL